MALTANILESLQSDLRTISNESKRKLPHLREAADAVMLKLRALSKSPPADLRHAIYEESVHIIDPFLMGCEFRQNQKVVQTSLNAIQRLITYQAIKTVAACKLVDSLWNLMENNFEDVKVLQTATLLLSTNNIVSGPILARTIVLCFRLYASKNIIVNNIASATIRQMISNIYERLETEDAIEYQKEQQQSHSSIYGHHEHNTDAIQISANSFFKKPPIDFDEVRSFVSGHMANLANALKMQYAPKSLRTAAADAFLLLRDLILLINDEQPLWMVGLTDINKEFILELLELIFISYSEVICRHPEFKILVRERVCSMILDLFSPDILHPLPTTLSLEVKHLEESRISVDKGDKIVSLSSDFNSVVSDMHQSTQLSKSISSSSMRILRVLSMMIQKFYVELVTSSRIFTSIFLQLLEYDSNLKQVAGPLKLARLSSADTGTAGTTISSVASSDIPVVTTMISKLFENSHLLKVKHLRVIIEQLSKLSTEFIDGRQPNQNNVNSPSSIQDDLSNGRVSASSKEPSPYILAKLLELALVNLHRVGCIWNVLTDHFFEVSKNSNSKVRDWGSCALTHLIKHACCYLPAINKKPDDNKAQQISEINESYESGDETIDVGLDHRALLLPLQMMSQIPYADIRQKQLEAVMQIIQSTTCDNILTSNTEPAREAIELSLNESLNISTKESDGKIGEESTPSRDENGFLSNLPSSVGGWPQIIDIIGTVDEAQTENLIRVAFQCLQSILSDYLNMMDCECIVLLIAAIVKFASQLQDLNVSLTAIGLLWNFADHLYQKKSSIDEGFKKKSAISETNYESEAPNLSYIFDYIRQTELSQYDSVWMALFAKLSEVCTDPRPAIRKSACQTLFATITTHGSSLELKTWQAVLWQILFPLLQQVKSVSGVAPDMRLSMQQAASSSLYCESVTDEESLNSGCDHLVVHHLRNTAQKQWSETQVLVMTGVTKVFIAKCDILVKMQNFNKAWLLLLDFIKSASLSKVFEISLAALKSMQDLISIDKIRSQINNDIGVQNNDTMCLSMWIDIWILPIIDLLNSYDEYVSVELREDFARCCYEGLLQLSHYTEISKYLNSKIDPKSVKNMVSIGAKTNFNEEEIINKLSIEQLLRRFMEVIIKYNHDERLAGKCPLPRNRMAEITFVLRAITKLLRSIKRTRATQASGKIWNQMLSLYPHLIDFATRNSPADQVKRDSLNETLLEFGSLLYPPAVSAFSTNSTFNQNDYNQPNNNSSQAKSFSNRTSGAINDISNSATGSCVMEV